MYTAKRVICQKANTPIRIRLLTEPVSAAGKNAPMGSRQSPCEHKVVHFLFRLQNAFCWWSQDDSGTQG